MPLDRDGWAQIDDVARAVANLLQIDVAPATIAEHLADDGRGFEIADQRIRVQGPRRGPRQNPPPDILYHATSEQRIEQVRASGTLAVGRGRNVYLSSSEAQAWRVAHRLAEGTPRVLYIDSSRARRRGIRFNRNRRTGLYVVQSVPVSFILNLQRNFAEQLSAGGIPVRMDEDGIPRLALIRVKRRSGVTWEVAKGKLEPGEVPEHTAVREVQEEMGLECGLTVTRHLGEIRYGFSAPGGLPRLKIVYLYLMEPDGPISCFHPSEREGIGDVQWFTPDDACRAVTHSSLIPLMQRARRILNEGANHGNRSSR